MQALWGYLPEWFSEWFKIYAVPFLKVEARKLLTTLLHGILDTLLFVGLPISISLGSQSVWNGRYNLTPTQQQQVEAWAGVSSIVAYLEDVPPVVPLVLWYKEGGLQAENPANCEGIMGLYTAVNTGQLPCFPPGPVEAQDVAYQLRLGARTFKEFCPQIHFTTTDPELLKQCYLFYNAGPRARTNPNQSGYVMNNYDIAHQDMIHTDVQGRTYRLQALGAWPVHLAMQAQMAQQENLGLPTFVLSPLLLAQESLDRIWIRSSETATAPDGAATTETCRTAVVDECFGLPHQDGDPANAPRLSPLLVQPTLGEETCGPLAGVDLTPPQPSVVLAPMSGMLTRYTDEWGHLAAQIENDEWSIWLTGLRSYTARPGEISAGMPIGAVSGAGGALPALHYAIYDKVNATFVDPVSFLPLDMCPAPVVEQNPF